MPSASVTGARPNSASCAPSTGVTQQSVAANRSTHTASGRLAISARAAARRFAQAPVPRRPVVAPEHRAHALPELQLQRAQRRPNYI